MREGWRNTPLSALTTQSKTKVRVSDASSYTSLGLRMYGKGVFARESKLGSEIKASTLYSVLSGQFIYNRMFAAGGSFGVIPKSLAHGVVSNEFPVFDCDEKCLLTSYLDLYFQQPEVWTQVERECTGTTQSRNRWKEESFGRHLFNLPPIEEQQRIVDLIGSLDEAIEAADAQSATLSSLLSSVQASIPSSREVQLGEILVGIESGISVSPSEWEAEGPQSRILKLSAIRPGRFNPNECKPITAGSLPDKVLVSDGDVLMTRSNTPDRVGYVCVVNNVVPKTYMPDLVWRLRFNADLCTASYLAHAMSSPLMRARVTSTASGTSQSMKKVNKKGISGVLIPLPNLADQMQYVKQAEAATDSLSAADTYATSLRTLRSELLTVLLSGEHEIPESYDAVATSQLEPAA